MSATILDAILQRTCADLEQRKRELPLERLLESSPAAGGAGSGRGRLRDALTAPGIRVIAEIKRRSPSAGVLREGLDVPSLAAAYEAAGASAISVLTDEPHFGGSLGDLEAAHAACALPILRKDFVVDPYQLHEAAIAGAAAVLLIAAALPVQRLAELRSAASALSLDTLVEVHDEAELADALSIGADLIGVNNRDLRDFSVDVRRTFELMEAMPSGVTVVSESGIGSPEQLRALEDAGVAAVLIGESLVRAQDPGQALGQLLQAGRSR
jgi:indole-3-glycerol phosphate synthase